MNKIYFLILISFGPTSFADNKCLSGQEKNSSLIDQLKTAQNTSSITKMIFEKYNLSKKQTEAQVPCLTCTNSNSQSAFQKIQTSLAKVPQPPDLIFRSECLQASHSFKAATSEVVCENKQSKKIPFSKNSPTQCINSEFLRYQNAVISNFLGCIRREGFASVDSASLFKMYSLESGFKPQYFSGNGSGLGQLTPIFVKDLFGNGKKIVNQISKSRSKECDVAKMIATQDLTNRPPLSQTCSFLSPGEGLERNILYSLMGMAHVWSSYVEKTFLPYQNKFSDDEKITEVRSLILMNSYGPRGQSGAKALARRLIENNIKPKEAIRFLTNSVQSERVDNLNVYTRRWNKREKDLKKVLTSPLKENYEKIGASACVTPL